MTTIMTTGIGSIYCHSIYWAPTVYAGVLLGMEIQKCRGWYSSSQSLAFTWRSKHVNKYKSFTVTDFLINRILWDTKTRTWKGNEGFLRGDDSWAVCLKMSWSLSDKLRVGHVIEATNCQGPEVWNSMLHVGPKMFSALGMKVKML